MSFPASRRCQTSSVAQPPEGPAMNALSHLEGAIQRLDRETAELELKRNLLRQEEITEEIELLMLSAKRLWRW